MAEYGHRFTDQMRFAEAPKQKRTEAGSHTADMSELLDMWNQQIELLSTHIAQVEARINTAIGQDPALVRRHQTARSVATHCPHYKQYYQRKIAEGKPERLVINNIINKLIRLYCAMGNNRSKYDPHYIPKMKKQWKKSA